MLQENGYYVGHTAKGWAPGNPGKINGKNRELLGPAFNKIKTSPPAKFISNNDYAANLEDFLNSNTDKKPFCFWYGSTEPHRQYEFRAGMDKAGKKLTDIDHVNEAWPDNNTVRTDMLDYAYEIEYFDSHIVKMLKILEERGLLENTIVVVTSDNGMPFPRVKAQEYELSNHMPLAIMWKKGIKNPGRIMEGFVSFTDFAPTFLDLAGVSTEKSGMQPMEGESLLGILQDKPGSKGRDFMIIGKERHDVSRPNDLGYPIRGIIQNGFMYLKNFAPDRWPAGNPETGYMECDGSPTKTYILNDRRAKGKTQYWDWNFGLRPGEELYKISEDPYCMNNLAGNAEHAKLKENLGNLMTEELKKEGDPRMFGKGDIFDAYPYSENANRDFYNRFMAGEPVRAGWIQQSDIERK